MALEITAAGAAKLIISGTATELPSIYARIDFGFSPNGSNCQGGLFCYNAKAEYTAEPSLLLTISEFQTLYSFAIDTAIEEQSLLTGHEKIKEQIELKGYSVLIVDL